MNIRFAEASLKTSSKDPNTRIEIPIDNGWNFMKGDFAGASDAEFDDSGWENVCLPHTWNKLDGQDGGDDYYRGPSWYRQKTDIPEEYSHRRVFLKFGAAGMVADVYVNGNFVGEHKGGFAAFVFDITHLLNFGKSNLIAVKVDNTSPQESNRFKLPPLSADFTMEGGLYRKAELIITNDVHISLSDYASPGFYIMQDKVTDSSAEISVKTKLKNDSKFVSDVVLESVIYDHEGKVIKEVKSKNRIDGEADSEIGQKMSLDKPHLWNGRIDPYLYKVVVSLYQDGKLIDEVEQPMGLRYYKVDPEKGFFLNGKPYKLHGVALHEDKKDEGRGITNEDRKQEMKYILDIGATVVRFAHYQYDEEMYRLCDKNGIVVWTEMPLVNQVDSSSAFVDNAEQQLKELIRQNYNHPSVFFWGIFNEIHQKNGPDPIDLVSKLDKLAKDEDPTRLTTAASDDEGTTNFVTEVLGLNKYFGWYYGSAGDLGPFLDKWHRDHPDRAIGISEYGAGANVYQHEELPSMQPQINGSWHPEEYQTFYHEVSWKAIESRPFIWFSTIWNMFDFASDSRREGIQPGINDKGLITQDHETKKDSYYWYKVNWNMDPMVHINGKLFTMRDTSVVTVEVYSNATEVELFVNGKSAGKAASGDHRFFWNSVNLIEGSNNVKVVATIDGKEYFDECWWRCSK